MSKNKIEMKIEMKLNKSNENIKSILYCAILFGDVETVAKILHPQGHFVGMSKARFLYFLQREHHKPEFNFIDEETSIWADLIDLGLYAGQRCFIFNREIKYNGKPRAFVFVMHPHQSKQVHKIVVSKKYTNEQTITRVALLFNQKKKNDYNLLFKN